MPPNDDPIVILFDSKVVWMEILGKVSQVIHRVILTTILKTSPLRNTLWYLSDFLAFDMMGYNSFRRYSTPVAKFSWREKAVFFKWNRLFQTTCLSEKYWNLTIIGRFTFGDFLPNRWHRTNIIRPASFLLTFKFWTKKSLVNRLLCCRCHRHHSHHQQCHGSTGYHAYYAIPGYPVAFVALNSHVVARCIGSLCCNKYFVIFLKLEIGTSKDIP